MFKNQEFEKLYNLAIQKDVSETIGAYYFSLKDVEELTPEKVELIELLIDMYTDVESVCDDISHLIIEVAIFNILNIDEIIEIIKPYHDLLVEKKLQGQPLSFTIQYKPITKGLTREDCNNHKRYCDITLFISQLSSNITLDERFKNFCIHSNVIKHIKENGNHSQEFLENLVIDLSDCETATVGYLCHHWLNEEYKKGRILPNKELKRLLKIICKE